jgi:hypothetical protein
VLPPLLSGAGCAHIGAIAHQQRHDRNPQSLATRHCCSIIAARFLRLSDRFAFTGGNRSIDRAHATLRRAAASALSARSTRRAYAAARIAAAYGIARRCAVGGTAAGSHRLLRQASCGARRKNNGVLWQSAAAAVSK